MTGPGSSHFFLKLKYLNSNERSSGACHARVEIPRCRVGEKAYCVSAASLSVDLRFDLMEGFRTMAGGDLHEFLAVGVTALYFVKAARRIAGPTNNGSACENLVHGRAGLGAVKQASARLGFQTN